MSGFMNRASFFKKHKKIYVWLYKNNPNLLDKLFPHNKILKYTKDMCEEKAKQFKRIVDWKNACCGYEAALKNGWLADCTKHMTNKVEKHSDQKIINTIRKYKNLKDFKAEHYSLYITARNRKLKELDQLNKRLYKRFVLNLDTKEMFETITEAEKFFNIKSGIDKCCKGFQKTAGGSRWAYCDEKGKVLK